MKNSRWADVVGVSDEEVNNPGDLERIPGLIYSDSVESICTVESIVSGKQRRAFIFCVIRSKEETMHYQGSRRLKHEQIMRFFTYKEKETKTKYT